MAVSHIKARQSKLLTQLTRRYPDVRVEVLWNDNTIHEHLGSYKGWFIGFQSSDLDALAKVGLSPWKGIVNTEGNAEFAGVTWHLYSYSSSDERGVYRLGFHIEEEPGEGKRLRLGLTKKTQAQVTRLLKPFIRRTWKPREGLHEEG